MKDSVSVNGKALRSGLWDQTAILDCMSHVVDRVGQCLEGAAAAALCSAVVALMAHSSNVSHASASSSPSHFYFRRRLSGET